MNELECIRWFTEVMEAGLDARSLVQEYSKLRREFTKMKDEYKNTIWTIQHEKM